MIASSTILSLTAWPSCVYQVPPALRRYAHRLFYVDSIGSAAMAAIWWGVDGCDMSENSIAFKFDDVMLI